MNHSISRVEDPINLISAGLKENCEYIMRQADEKYFQMWAQLRTWMTEPVVEAQQKHSEASKLTISEHTSV